MDEMLQKIRGIYFDSLGRKAYTTRMRSDMGKMEMECIGKALNRGHVPTVHVDDKLSSFMTCAQCDMMGSMTHEEGSSGNILEVNCGTKVSTTNLEQAWDQAEDPYKYQVEARLFDDDLPDGEETRGPLARY